MLTGILGKKVGMTQVFADRKVVPVTVIDISHWYIVGSKSEEKDGYKAVKIGLLRKKYQGQEVAPEWAKNLKHYFEEVREINLQGDFDIQVGQVVDYSSVVAIGDHVDVFGKTKGRGFQGVVKRHGFTGGRASHGPRLGRIPGSIGYMRSQGRVIKGKKLPGHMGVEQKTMKNLEVIRIEPEHKIILVKGSVPGHAGSLLYMKKA